MKDCPQCGAHYMDQVDFCFEDGSVLIVDESAAVTEELDWDDELPMPGNIQFGGQNTAPPAASVPVPSGPVPALQFTPAPAIPLADNVQGFLGGDEMPPSPQIFSNAPPPVDAPVPAPKKASPAPVVEELPEIHEFVEVADEHDADDEQEEPGKSRKTWLFFGGVAATTVLGVGALGLAGSVLVGGLVITNGADEANQAEPSEVATMASPEIDVAAKSTPKVVEPIQDAIDEPAIAEPAVAGMNEPGAAPLTGATPGSPGSETPEAVAQPVSAVAVNTDPQPANGGTGNPVPEQPASQPVTTVKEIPSSVAKPVKPDPVGTTTPVDTIVEKKPVEPAAPIIAEPKKEAPVEEAPAKEPVAQKRLITVLVTRPSATTETKLLVNGIERGEGMRWPLRLKLEEGSHEFTVVENGVESKFKKDLPFKETMIVLSLTN